MTVRGAVFLGIEAMVGAGIFALLGEAATVAGSAVWLSFRDAEERDRVRESLALIGSGGSPGESSSVSVARLS